MKFQSITFLLFTFISVSVYAQNAKEKKMLEDPEEVSISKEEALNSIYHLRGLISPVEGTDGKMKYTLRTKDVENYMPYAVTHLPNGETKIDYEQIIPFLAEAIQKLFITIEDVEAENNRLKEEAANETIRVNNELKVLFYDVATLKAQLIDLYPPVTEESTDTEEK